LNLQEETLLHLAKCSEKKKTSNVNLPLWLISHAREGDKERQISTLFVAPRRLLSSKLLPIFNLKSLIVDMNKKQKNFFSNSWHIMLTI